MKPRSWFGGLTLAAQAELVTPAAIELEDVIRQAIPTKEGRPDVSVGNLVGTLLYFALFNLGLIALLTPARLAGPRRRYLAWLAPGWAG